MHKTAAWPLAVLYAGLIVYASLYPFADWRNQDLAPWFFLSAPPAYYWTGFDVAMNVVGYVPLGGLLALSGLRTRRVRHSVWVAVFACAALSMALETLQSYLPVRVPSREDFMLNTLGAAIGAVLTLLLERLGAIDRWSRVRSRWFVPDARGGIVLLLTWPLALLFPPAVPFGLGQVLERLEDAVASQLEGTPFLQWLPVRAVELQPMLAGAQMVCVLLGLLIPCLLGFCVVRVPWRRAAVVWMTLAVGAAVTALSASLSWGPQHAWAWLDLPTQVGMGIALVLALAMAWVPWRASAAVLLLALGVYLSVLNQAPEGAYFAQTLQAWEQGRFIRFNGLAQWLGWLWPYAVLGYVLPLIWRREPKN
ncbi:MAG: VanZ family protein [Burkholderiales bacterium]|nr:VanZ family protein [Burkholderiales bacterium]MBP8053268.1 VanZ family protein [Burkholderiaceae bacterium]